MVKMKVVEVNHGVCPKCGGRAEIVNVGSYYHGVCRTHKVSWLIGRNLSKDWRGELKSTWDKTRRLLQSYKRIKLADAVLPADGVVSYKVSQAKGKKEPAAKPVVITIHRPTTPLAEHIRNAIRRSGLSAAALSKVTGVKQPTITEFLRGKDIRLGTAQKLMDHFGIVCQTKDTP